MMLNQHKCPCCDEINGFYDCDIQILKQVEEKVMAELKEV